ncbi:14500_t:CDS:2, partial [Gigaspora margarita]
LDMDDFSVCLEDTVDMSQVVLKSVIKCVDLVNIKESNNAIFSISLIKSHWYKRNTNLDNVDTLFSHFGVSNKMNDIAILGFSEVQVSM